jgi:hypothetical protein
MQINGEFLFWGPRRTSKPIVGAPDLVLPNLVTTAGAQEYLRMIFQDVTVIAGGANWYVGMMDQAPALSTLLSDLSTEPTVTNGYARQPLVRNATDWPTQLTINGRETIRSVVMSFTASGGDFSAAFSRFFLTDQASGTAGVLYAVSGPRDSALLVLDGETVQVGYRTYLN